MAKPTHRYQLCQLIVSNTAAASHLVRPTAKFDIDVAAETDELTPSIDSRRKAISGKIPLAPLQDETHPNGASAVRSAVM